ncbi:hypothetical protein HW555_007326 [Spodoptera exigua]|uniref:Uncharacterized protein n=1 Tax=Spodoptera exigua TaxID=7107 RepID=A0A835GD20_SPOEX|nr:hypothetical protein HW555_007326 [Spodoptera exigua]
MFNLSTDGVHVTHSLYGIVVKFKVVVDDDLHITDTICKWVITLAIEILKHVQLNKPVNRN